MAKLIQKGLFLLSCLILCSCAETPQEEYIWQGLHVIDSAQTLQIAKSSCYQEDNQAWLIGHHPSTTGVLAWAIGAAGLHALVSTELRKHDWPLWAQWTWQALTIGDTAYAVKNNHDQGIGVTSSNC